MIRTNLPVMVWIYGGGWWTGASELYIGSGIVAQSVAIVGSPSDHPIIAIELTKLDFCRISPSYMSR